MKNFIFLFIIIFAVITSCSTNEQQKNEQEDEFPRELTEVELEAKNMITNRISKVSIKYLSGEETAELAQKVAEEIALHPDNILPLMSYYDFYNDKLGLHYKQSNWKNLKFYKDVEGAQSTFYETNYKFTAMDKNNIFYWRHVAVKDNGDLSKEKLGGLVFLMTTEWACVDGFHVKYYLENKETVLFEDIANEFTCDLANGIGAALEYSKLEKLAKSPVKAVEIIEKGNGQTILLPVDNPSMKDYFINLKKLLDSGLGL